MTVRPTEGRQEALERSDPRQLASEWIRDLGSALESGDLEATVDLFHSEGWLRDKLALTWDLRTFHGQDAIRRVIEDRAALTGFSNFALDERIEPTMVGSAETPQWVQASFTFETAVGRGRGFVRLVDDPGSGSRDVTAWAVMLKLEELRGHEEASGHRRPHGVEHGATRDSENWLDRRRRKEEFLDSDPNVLVIGAGQSGLSIAARLTQLGVDTLVLERLERVGDSWRNRYHSLVLHDPVFSDHLPYLKFPATFPRFIPKDKLADWFEAYVSILELNVWTSSSVEACSYDAEEGSWQVLVTRGDGTVREIRPRHLIFATGHSGLPYVPAIPGAEDFGGEMVHSSQYRGAADIEGKKVLVVGAGNSSHDICHDLAEAGADVTMLQRSKTYVLGSENAYSILFRGSYEEDGPETEDADHVAHSLPMPVAAEMNERFATPAIAKLDAPILEGLREAGYNLNEEQGLVELYFTKGGSYYIDVGAATAIIEGKIKVRSGVEIDHFTKRGAAFSDGVEENYDLVVLATGYGNMREVARLVVGDEIADQITPVWGFDREGEINAVWRPSGHDGIWFMAGNLGTVRHISLALGLQIKAIEEGLMDRYRESNVLEAESA
jgi:cation diffusion facilitator CzcD-associated flavoprotein CzcO